MTLILKILERFCEILKNLSLISENDATAQSQSAADCCSISGWKVFVCTDMISPYKQNRYSDYRILDNFVSDSMSSMAKALVQ